MPEINDSALMAALGRQMTQAVQKQAVSAGNLANLDTPGFRTQEISFNDLLDGEVEKLGLTTTASNQLPGATVTTAQTNDADGLESRRDGNNVQLDRELLAMGKASSEFSAAQAALSAKFRLIRFAINEGR